MANFMKLVLHYHCKIVREVVVSVTVKTRERERESEWECKTLVTLPPYFDEEELKVIASESLIVILFLGVCGPPWFFPILGFPR